MNTDDKSSHLGRRTHSFRISDFTLRNLPTMAIALVFLTLINLLAFWFPRKFLPERWGLVPGAVMLGFILGMLCLSWLAGPEPKINYDLSPEIQALARDPSQLVAAIKLFREAHPDVSLTQAKERIERFCKTGK